MSSVTWDIVPNCCMGGGTSRSSARSGGSATTSFFKQVAIPIVTNHIAIKKDTRLYLKTAPQEKHSKKQKHYSWDTMPRAK